MKVLINMLGYPYKDDSHAFMESDVTQHIGDFPMQINRGDYSKIVVGLDWGQHDHSIVVLGIKETGMIDVIRMFRVKKSVGVDHLEEDLNTIIYTLDNYKPDLILADEGYNMNYNDKLKAYYGINHVYGVKTRSARSNGDAVAHFSDTDNTVTIDKLSQVLLLMASLRRGDFRFYKGKYGLDDMERLFIEHAKNVIIRADEVENNITHQIEEQLIITRKGGDHLFIAMTYAYVAMRKIIAERSNQAIDVSTLGTSIDFEQTDLQKELNVKKKTIDF